MSRWRPTGHRELVRGHVDRVPVFDPRTGEHLWIMLTVYRVDPLLWTDPVHAPTLDHESLISVTGPGCYYCEQPYGPRVAARRCRGTG